MCNIRSKTRTQNSTKVIAHGIIYKLPGDNLGFSSVTKTFWQLSCLLQLASYFQRSDFRLGSEMQMTMLLPKHTTLRIAKHTFSWLYSYHKPADPIRNSFNSWGRNCGTNDLNRTANKRLLNSLVDSSLNSFSIQIINKTYRIIAAIGKHVIARQALACCCITIPVQESTPFGVVVTGLEVVEVCF